MTKHVKVPECNTCNCTEQVLKISVDNIDDTLS